MEETMPFFGNHCPNIPKEIYRYILSLLTVRSLCIGSQVCKKWHEECNSDDLWKRKCELRGWKDIEIVDKLAEQASNQKEKLSGSIRKFIKGIFGKKSSSKDLLKYRWKQLYTILQKAPAHKICPGEAKVLILGTAFSGKSTLLRQLADSEMSDYTIYKDKIFLNMILAIQHTVQKLGLQIKQVPKSKDFIVTPLPQETLNAFMNTNLEISESESSALEELWKIPDIKNELEFSTDYGDLSRYLNNMNSFMNSTMTLHDAIRCRSKTTGIVEVKYSTPLLNFKFVDVGGFSLTQYWIHCFENISHLVYVSDLSCYDLVLYEDNTVNRLEEEIDLWHQIVNSKWMTDSSILVYFNKLDVFKRKVQKIPFQYRGYTGNPHNPDDIVAFLKAQFESAQTSPRTIPLQFMTGSLLNPSSVRDILSVLERVTIETSLKDTA